MSFECLQLLGDMVGSLSLAPGNLEWSEILESLKNEKKLKIMGKSYGTRKIKRITSLQFCISNAAILILKEQK